MSLTDEERALLKQLLQKAKESGELDNDEPKISMVRGRTSLGVQAPRKIDFVGKLDPKHLTEDEIKLLQQAQKDDERIKQQIENGNISSRRNHRPSNLTKVRCIKCGQEEWVSANLILDPKRYRCNDCCTKPLS